MQSPASFNDKGKQQKALMMDFQLLIQVVKLTRKQDQKKKKDLRNKSDIF